MLIMTNYPDDRFNHHEGNLKQKMEFDFDYGEYSFSMVLNQSGPYYLKTDFTSYYNCFVEK